MHAYRLVPFSGKTKELSAQNCKEIKEALSNECLHSGVYWVQNQQVHMYRYCYILYFRDCYNINQCMYVYM